MSNITFISNQGNKFEPCPEFSGQAKIVDVTETRTYSSQYGDKDGFRYILEINLQRPDGTFWTVATKPLTESLHEKANLRKVTEKVLGRPMTASELKDWDTENLIGKYCSVEVEQSTREGTDTVFANVTHIGKVKDKITWDSNYVRLNQRVKKNGMAAANIPKIDPNKVEIDFEGKV